jgi:hypothetical protein
MTRGLVSSSCTAATTDYSSWAEENAGMHMHNPVQIPL